ncbi:MAG: hypothetical protein ACYCT7_04240 [bacterium]
MQIKIIEKNRRKIKTAIKKVEGKSRVNLLSVQNIFDFADMAENKLNGLKIPIKNRASAIYRFCPECPTAKAYEFQQGATDIRIIRRCTGWYVDSIDRVLLYPQTNEINRLGLTIEQREIAIAHFCKRFDIIKEDKNDNK